MATATAAQIFISYRRDDSAGYARAIGDELARRFGAERVFIDVDDIGAGLAFDEVLRSAVGDCQVLLVLIGTRWRGERAGLPPRIDDPGDFVRLEVAAALAKGMRVIPLLLDGTPMPAEAQLPEVLRPLARRNALEIGNTRFAADMERLAGVLREVLGEVAPVVTPAAVRVAPTPARRRALAAVVASGLALSSIAAWWSSRRSAPADGAAASAGRAAGPVPNAARPGINGEWLADVVYDWPNARYRERFTFGGEAAGLHGSASFLGVSRGVLEGAVEAGGVRFLTRTGELGSGGAVGDTVHRYRARLAGGELHVVMQTEGSSTAHVPVEFIARRVAP